MFTTSHPYSSFTDIHLLLSLDKIFRRVAMILQCFASDGRPLPYFHRGDPGVPGFAGPPGQPGVPGIPPRTSACLTLGSVYPCSLNCTGWYTPWMGATAVAPMILVDWTTQLAQDVSPLSPTSSSGDLEQVLTTILASRVRCGTARAAIPSRKGSVDAPVPR